MIREIIKKDSGFTILETIVAVGLIAVGLVAALALISTSLFYVSNIQNRLIAANLMAEGIETVRNIRDNNWLQNQPWNNGLANGDYQTACQLPSCGSILFSSYSGNPLLYDSNTGLYNYGSGTATSFVRKISITNLSSYEIQVVSMVSWQRGKINYSDSAEEHLFNWK